MLFDYEMIKKYYDELSIKLGKVRGVLNRPLTLSEKLLYSHLYNNNLDAPLKRGVDYVEFSPDRVAMQDATAQMALLQFMMAGKNTTSVPSSVHCDHLIMAKVDANVDLKVADIE